MNTSKLRKVNVKKDLEEIFLMMMNAKEQMLFYSKININSVMEFENWFLNQLRYNYHDFYVATTSTDEIIGFVFSYEFAAHDGHCNFCVYIKEGYRTTGTGAYAAIVFLDELFREYPLKKVYSHIYNYNKQSLACNISGGFVEEGCLREYRYYDGESHDLHIMSIDRSTFNKKLKPLLNNEIS